MCPPVINDAVLGELKFDPTDYLLWYKGVGQFAPGDDVEVIVKIKGGEPFDILERARAAFTVIQHRAAEYPPFAAKELLDAYNENWNDEQPISAETFVGRIWLYSFAFDPDGTVELRYDDDDMFLGHTIVVHLDADLNVSWGGIEG
jgi:hypothetical protein